MTHALFTLSGCPFSVLDDEELIRSAVTQAAEECGATFLGLRSHKFSPQGVTCAALLAESHITIHTWPERGVAACDIFTCGDANPSHGVDYLFNRLQATNHDCLVVTRPLAVSETLKTSEGSIERVIEHTGQKNTDSATGKTKDT